MNELTITPATKPMRGSRNVPADKSITHRALILGALAQGTSRIENFLDCETTRATLDCLRGMGVESELIEKQTLTIRGNGLRSLREPNEILFCKGSGTTMRLLAGVCAGQNFLSVLDGTSALKRRPMARVIEPLRAMGAHIAARAHDTLPPLVIRGGRLHGIDYTLPVASAQVKSALLLAGLFSDSPVTLREPAPSRDHTERMFRALGVNLCNESETTIRLIPTSDFQLPTFNFQVPNDLSSAAFPLVAALLIPHSEIGLPNVGVNPTRIGLLDVLKRMGASVEWDNMREINNEPRADLRAHSCDTLSATTIAGADIPRLIDEVPILAVLATQAHGVTFVREASELRVKESDRITLLARELRKFGARIQEHADGFAIEGPSPLHGARVETHHDHRLAMSFAVAGLIAKGETIIQDWDCVADSFPNFEQIVLQSPTRGIQ